MNLLCSNPLFKDQLYMQLCCLVAELCPTLWDLMDCSQPDCSHSSQECWNELSFPSPGDLVDPEIEPTSPVLASRFFTAEPPRKPLRHLCSPPTRGWWLYADHKHTDWMEPVDWWLICSKNISYLTTNWSEQSSWAATLTPNAACKSLPWKPPGCSGLLSTSCPFPYLALQ